MGLYGLAKRAGAAYGALMADRENYSRRRQEELDRMKQDEFNLLSSLRRQQMGFAANADARSAAAEQRAIEEFTQNQKWNAQTRTWAEEDRKSRLAQEVEDRKRAEEMHNARIDHINAQTDQIDAKSDYLQNAQTDYTDARTNAYLNKSGNLYNMAGRPANRSTSARTPADKPAGAGAAGKPITDAGWAKIADSFTPEEVQEAFNRKFYDTDENVQERTGMSREQFLKALTDQYRSHVLTKRENALDLDDFIRNNAGKYGFWDVHELGRLSRDMERKDKYGIWGFRRSAEEEYARRNPAFYKRQKELITGIDNGVNALLGKGRNNDEKAAFSLLLKENPDAVRTFEKYRRKKGLSEGDAAAYALIHIYAKQNNLNANAMIDYFRNKPGREKSFIRFVRQNGIDAAMNKFNTPTFGGGGEWKSLVPQQYQEPAVMKNVKPDTNIYEESERAKQEESIEREMQEKANDNRYFARNDPAGKARYIEDAVRRYALSRNLNYQKIKRSIPLGKDGKPDYLSLMKGYRTPRDMIIDRFTSNPEFRS